MEVGPQLHQYEAEPTPDLLEAFADQEVTIFGVTGSFSDLAAMCPVDLSDARVTLDMKNEFVVKVANEAGMEVDEKYESVFSRVLEDKGIERKFTVAERVVEDEVPEQREEVEQAKLQSEPERVKTSAELPVPAQRNPQPEEVVQEVASAVLVQQHAGETSLAHADITVPDEVVQAMAEHNELPEELDAIQPVSEAQVIAAANTNTDIRSGPSLEVSQVEMVTMQILKEYEERLSSELAHESILVPEVAAVTVEEIIGLSERDVSEAIADQFMEPLVLPAVVGAEPVNDFDVEAFFAVERSVEPEDIWLAELHKESVEIVDDIAAALLALFGREESAGFVTDMVEGADVRTEGTTGFVSEIEPLATTPEAAVVPPVVRLVAEQLAQLEPGAKEVTAPIMKNIAGAIHAIHVLEARQSEPEVLAEVRAELEALCAELFEAIGIEYDEDMVRQFALVVSRPDFMTMQKAASLTEVDLEREGTREAKRGLHALATNLHISDKPLERLLGVLAVFYLMTVRKAQSQMMSLDS